MDLQEITEHVAALLRAPATLEDRDFHLVAYAAHDDTIDPVRLESILHRRATEAVRARFERHGIARADGPVRIPADPSLNQLGRLCLPVRWNNVTYGYLWLLDDEERITPAEAAEAMPLCDRAGLLMARQARERDDLGWKVADLLSTHPDARTQAADDLTDAGVATPPFTVAVATDPDAGATEPVAAPPLRPDDVLATRPRAPDPGFGVHPHHPRPGASPPGGTQRPRPGRGPLPLPDLRRRPRSWLRARVAARAAAPGETRDWTTLGVLRLLRTAGDEALTRPPRPPARPACWRTRT